MKIKLYKKASKWTLKILSRLHKYSPIINNIDLRRPIIKRLIPHVTIPHRRRHACAHAILLEAKCSFGACVCMCVCVFQSVLLCGNVLVCLYVYACVYA